jgi:hypothetical protein
MPDDTKNVNNDEIEADQDAHEQERVENELDEQQDLNQGMSTGTHSSTRSGVNWPASYRGKLTPDKEKKG